MLEQPAAFPVHGQAVFGLVNLRKVLDRFFFFKRLFYSFSASLVQVSVWLHVAGRIHPWGSSYKIQPQIYINAVLANTEKNQSYNYRCLEWTRERQLNQCLTHKGRGEIIVPSMQWRRNGQGIENMEEWCNFIFFNILPEQKDTYKF